MESDLDLETSRLASQIRELLGEHMSKNTTKEIGESMTACLIALYAEVGRLRWLFTEAGEVTPDCFDEVFWSGAIKHFDDNKRRYGGSGH